MRFKRSWASVLSCAFASACGEAAQDSSDDVVFNSTSQVVTSGDGRAAVDGYFATPTSFLLDPGYKTPISWKFTTEEPDPSWNQPGFNDASWSPGVPGFGEHGMPGDVINTPWTTSDIWLRKEVSLNAADVPRVAIWARWDDVIDVYVNGVRAAYTQGPLDGMTPEEYEEALRNSHHGWSDRYRYLPLRLEGQSAFVPGNNTIAVHVRDEGGGRYVDLGLAPNPMYGLPTTGTAVPGLVAATEYVKKYMSANVIPGGVLSIMKENKVVLSQGFGYRDKALTTPVPPDAILRQASIDKAFTRNALVRLIAQGFWDPVTQQTLTLDTPVFPLLAARGLTLLPGRTLPDGINDITIQHVFDVRGGLPDIPGDASIYELTGTTADTYTIADGVRLAYSTPLLFPPGTDEEYNSTGHMVLRYLLRMLKGPFEPFMQKEVMGPAGGFDLFVARERLEDRLPREIWYATLEEPADRWIGLEEFYALQSTAESLNLYARRYDIYDDLLIHPATGLWTAPTFEAGVPRVTAGVMGGSWAMVKARMTDQVSIALMFNLRGYFDPAIHALDELTAALPPEAWSIAGPSLAHHPQPNDGARNMSTNPPLSWQAGSGASSHDVYFGSSYPLTFRGNRTTTSFSPGTLAANTTYYWRVDERSASGSRKGTTWSFTTAGTVPAVATTPSPAQGATGVSTTPTLTWNAGGGATSHDVYFGPLSEPPPAANRAVTSFVPSTLQPNTWYSWRIEERNGAAIVPGVTWRFKTGAGPSIAFSDSFESGLGAWTPSGGTWGVSTDGTQVYRQTNLTGDARTSAGTSSWTNQRVSVRVKPIAWNGTNRFVAVLARFQNASNHYAVALRSNNTLELRKVVGGMATTLASKAFTVATGTWYTVRLECIGTSISVSIDGTPHLSRTDSSLASGKAGLATFNASAVFDDVAVTE